MPRDIAIYTRVPGTATDAYKKSIGRTDFVFEIFSNDIQFNTGKQVITTEGTLKIVQSILKILLTKQGENVEDGDYGADLDVGVGEKLNQQSYADLRSNILDALNHYNLLNQDNENPDEIIGNIDEVKVTRDTQDPRIILIYIKVTTQAGNLVSVIVPQVV